MFHKITIFLLLFTSTVIFPGALFAQGVNRSDYDSDAEINQSFLGAERQICTITSEPCGLGKSGWAISGSGQNARYKCCVSAKTWFVDFIADIYKYVFFISLVIWVLLVVVMGIGISISWIGTEEIKAKSKERIFAILSGLMAMALIPWILKTVAPFFFK